MRITMMICVCLLCLPATAQKKKEIRVATYNLRYDNPGDGINAWPNRKENVKALIRFHDFDIFGTQEGLVNQLKDLCEIPGYTYFGAGRDDGLSGGEHSAIFYKTDRFKLLDAGNFWLSETPDKPGKGWDATCCNRICSWIKFKDANTKKVFFVFNVHFDHQGVVARKESGKLMMQKIKEISGDTPVIFTGDLNSTPDTEQVQTIQTIMSDSYMITALPPYGPVGTFNGFRFDAALKERIDYIFVSRHFSVSKYAVLTDALEQRYPSDHMPVVADVEIKHK
jgi:endonuclease/exonuclease/phosphatase family metal-dependent hydrolase